MAARRPPAALLALAGAALVLAAGLLPAAAASLSLDGQGGALRLFYRDSFSPPAIPTPGTYALTVTLAGTGTAGTVSSSPAGISCDAASDPCSANFVAPQAVTLTATANGDTFVGWSGEGCSGTGTCTVTMSQARSVTATFDAP